MCSIPAQRNWRGTGRLRRKYRVVPNNRKNIYDVQDFARKVVNAFRSFKSGRTSRAEQMGPLFVQGGGWMTLQFGIGGSGSCHKRTGQLGYRMRSRKAFLAGTAAAAARAFGIDATTAMAPASASRMWRWCQRLWVCVCRGERVGVRRPRRKRKQRGTGRKNVGASRDRIWGVWQRLGVSGAGGYWTTSNQAKKSPSSG